ncbi:MAG: carboxypeptidase-like regulatory domain-containing protein [Planctomycetota bacterium]|nr:carboxypeptidase-like regulatory domain-containing protein [Planctomycetota bacterium]
MKHCTACFFAEAGPYCWIGSSDDDAFFDMLPPGEYEVHVHAPRLPAWSRKVKVTAGKRETLTAELTVNNLPKVGE